MKKIILLLLFISIVSANIFSCIIEFEPEKINMKKGEVQSVLLKLKYEHRKCELTLDDTQYEVKGLKILEKSEWNKKKRGEFTQKIKIKLIDDKGYLKIIRECSKKGISEGILKVN